MDETELIHGFIEVLDGIYAPKKTFARLQNFIKIYNYPKSDVKITSMIGFKEVIDGLKIIAKIGFRSPVSFHFWKLFFWVYFNKRKHLEAAVVYSLIMHQMHLTAEKLKTDARKRLAELAAMPESERQTMELVQDFNYH